MKKQTTTFVVPDLCCSTEEAVIRNKLQSLNNVEIRGINLVERTVHVCHTCPAGEVLSELNSTGMKARLLNDVVAPPTFRDRYGNLLLMILSAFFLVGGLVFSFTGGSGTLSILLFLLSIAGSGWNIIRKGFRSMLRLSLDMNFLMTIATFGAMVIGKWEEGAVVIFLFALAEELERASLKRSRNAIRSLLNLTPHTAACYRNGALTDMDVQEIRPGDRIVIKPGEQVSLDGIVVAGKSTVNQAPITGESQPVAKRAGDEVYAGSYNERGALELRVTKRYDETMLARVVRLVEEAQESRAPVQSLIERFARSYTPLVFGAAFLTALLPPLLLHLEFSVWFYRALVLLVIACPCALVLSTPVTIMSALVAAARQGILIKGGSVLEALATVKAAAFDKTGTLTQGRAQVTDIIPLGSHSPEEIIALSARIERHSDHHLAQAILARAEELPAKERNGAIEQFESITGKGARALIDGQQFYIGSHTLLEELKLCSPAVEKTLEALEQEGKTTVIIATDREPIGILAITDRLRKETTGLVHRLHHVGITKTILLTGDNEQAARTIAKQMGIDEVQANVLPHEKVLHVEELKKRYGSVAMVGDGINDAPALAAATVGIAMGKTGSDISLETADVVLVSDNIESIASMMTMSKRALRLIRQNIMIALVTKIIFLLLGITGYATLWMAIIADDGATLAVILNGMRALRFRHSKAL